MKRILIVFFVPMVLLIFFGTAMANGNGAVDKTDTKQIVTPKHDEEPAAGITLAQIDEHRWGQSLSQQSPPRWWCPNVLSYFCGELCGDVSQSRGGGSRQWGKSCGPGLMRRCDRCGFLE